MDNGYYGASYGPDNIRAGDQSGGAEAMMGIMGPDGMPSPALMGGQSLDDIVSQNSKQMRRRSVPYNFQTNNSATVEPNPRRVSLMDFGDSTTGSPLDSFQFDPGATGSMDGFMNSSTGVQSGNDAADRNGNAVPLALNTQYANQNFGSMGPPGSAYASPMQPNTGMDMDVASPYLQSGLSMSMDAVDPIMSGMMGNETSAVPYYNSTQQQHFASPAVGSPVHATFQNPSQSSQLPKMRRGSASGTLRQTTSDQLTTTPDVLSSRAASSVQSGHSSSRHASVQSQQVPNRVGNMNFGPDPAQQMPVKNDSSNDVKVPWTAPPGK